MAKRTRGVTSTSAYRPGHAPVKRSAASSSAVKHASQPSAASPGVAPVAGLDAAILASDPMPVAAPNTLSTAPRSPVASHQRGHIKMKPNSVLAARAAQEYVYVGEDLRHIAVVATSLFAVLILLWLVVVVANVFGIY